MKTIIKTPAGYVRGFSAAQQSVQVTASVDEAKRFTPESALKFLDTYADAGYGLTRSSENWTQQFAGEKVIGLLVELN